MKCEVLAALVIELRLGCWTSLPVPGLGAWESPVACKGKGDQTPKKPKIMTESPKILGRWFSGSVSGPRDGLLD